MSNMVEPERHDAPEGRSRRSLRDVLTVVKNRHADFNDATDDARLAEQSRLELLADELRPIMDAIDERDERFELALARGETVRLWIDMTSFVVVGRDFQTMRFLKDTRGGRLVLAESDDIGIMADTIAEYVGERVIERERALDGEWISLKSQVSGAGSVKNGQLSPSGAFVSGDILEQTPSSGKRLATLALWFLFGASCALIILAAVFAYRTPSAF